MNEIQTHKAQIIHKHIHMPVNIHGTFMASKFCGLEFCFISRIFKS